MSVELEEVAPGRFRVRRDRLSAPRSSLPMPMVISDQMEPTEQVDGKFYTSKRAFRAVGRANGLTEVGNEKFKPRVKPSDMPGAKEARKQSIKKAIERVRAGDRSHSP